VHFGDEMRFDVQVGHLGHTSYSLIIEVANLTSGAVAMKARLVMVVLDKATGKPTSVPNQLREAFAPYLIEL
jgi:acyl-CoA thioesterase FadM